MFPLRDRIPAKSFPVITICIIIVNILVYIYQMSLGNNINTFINNFAVIPVSFSSLTDKPILDWFILFPRLFTSMFIHGGIIHLLGNLWYLWIFGDNVEDFFGHFYFLLFYLVGGMVGALAHIYFNLNSNIPTIGASGAIAAVMGAYIMLYPKSRITTIVFIIIYFTITEIPSLFFLGFWIVLQLLYASFSAVNNASGGGVAWWAHIGGFAFGMVLAVLFRFIRKQKKINLSYLR